MASRGYAATDATVSVGRVFGRGFGVLRDNPVTVFGVVLLFQALPSLLINLVQRSAQGTPRTRDALLGFGAMSIGVALVGLILFVIVQGALVRATVACSEGRRASLGESVSAGLAVIVPLIALSILMAIGIGLGFVLLIVPGILLAVMWAVASPALVAERTGVFAAFGRSRALTKGARWKVFGIELLLVVVIYSIAILFALVVMRPATLAGMRTQALSVGVLLLNTVVTTLLGAVWSTVQTALYVELRQWKDGPSVGGLADIFS